jgi:hypothetical protein
MFFVEYRQSDMGPQRTVSERKIFYMNEIPNSLTSHLWKKKQLMTHMVNA